MADAGEKDEKYDQRNPNNLTPILIENPQ